MRSAFGCAGLGLLLLLVAGTFDAEPLYVTGSALALLGLGAAGWIAAGALGRRRSSASSARRSVLEEQPLAVRDHRRARARCRCRPAGSTSRCCPSPCASRPAGAPRACASRSASAAAGAAGSRRRRSCCATRSGSPSRSCAATTRTRSSSCPRTYPVNVTAAGGEARPAHARAALIAAAETEIDGLRPFRDGTPASRIHWPSVARGHGMMERKLISESDSRPLVVLDPRAPASQDALDAAVRAAGSLLLHFARRSGCGSAAARRPPRGRRSSPTCSPGRRRTCGWRCSTTAPARR